jgi:hypothetical protein
MFPVLDERFVFPMVSFILESDQVALHMVLKLLIKHGWISYCILALSQEEETNRNWASSILVSLMTKVELIDSKDSFEGQQEIWMILHFIKASVVEVNRRIPRLICSFAARYLISIFDETSLAMEQCTKLLLQSDSGTFDLNSVPFWASLFSANRATSSSLADQSKLRLWILEVVEHGVFSSLDIYICENSNVFSEVMTFFLSEICSPKQKAVIFGIIRRALLIPKGLHELLVNYGLIAWIGLSINCCSVADFQSDAFWLRILDILDVLVEELPKRQQLFLSFKPDMDYLLQQFFECLPKINLSDGLLAATLVFGQKLSTSTYSSVLLFLDPNILLRAQDLSSVPEISLPWLINESCSAKSLTRIIKSLDINVLKQEDMKTVLKLSEFVLGCLHQDDAKIPYQDTLGLLQWLQSCIHSHQFLSICLDQSCVFRFLIALYPKALQLSIEHGSEILSVLNSIFLYAHDCFPERKLLSKNFQESLALITSLSQGRSTSFEQSLCSMAIQTDWNLSSESTPLSLVRLKDYKQVFQQ